MDEAPREFGFNTRAVHAGQRPDPYTGASATPIYQTAGFVFEDTESASAYFNLQEYGNVYSRIMNPTVAAFEERLANLEGGVGAVAFASGLAAQAGLFFALLEPGDRIAVAKALYGGSTAQLNHLARKLQITVDWVDMDDPDGWRRSVTAETKALFAETIANPGGNVLDISLAAAVAHEVGAPLVVDNTFATPYLCRPLEFGADLIIHSATKFIAGNGTTIAGAVVDSGTFDWSNGRFPSIAEPSTAYHGLKFHETFGVYGLLMKLRAETLRDFGAVLAPFNAFLLLLGIESLAVRMDRHVANALAVAEWLREQQGVGAVRHPALPDSPYRPLVDRYLPAGAGSVFSFDLESGREGGRRFIEALVALEPSRQRRRHEEPRHPSRLHDASPALGRGARRVRSRARDGAAVGGARGRGRSRLGPRARPAGGARLGRHRVNEFQDRRTMQEIVLNAHTVAIVGLSASELRASNFVGYYLQRHGYRVIPVNPNEEHVLGEQVYPSLRDVPEQIDVVDVFRDPAAVPEIAREAVEVGAGALWLQFGVISPEGARIAQEGGLAVVMDRCLKVEHARLLGRMHWMGFDTGVIAGSRG